MILDTVAIGVIMLLGFAPMLLSIWGIHLLARHPRLYSRRRGDIDQWRVSYESSSPWTVPSDRLTWLVADRYRGDTSCRFNAHSPFLRCAVNPEGPCQNCPYYEPSPHLTQH